MSYSLNIPVKENMQELRKLLRQSSVMMQPRIKMLIAMKKEQAAGISKRALMDAVGACSQSIQNWRTWYKQGGMEALLANGRKGNAGKPSVFTKQEHLKMGEKLSNPQNGLAGFVELQKWIEQEFNKEIKYNTVLKYASKHFGAKVKVARKSHVRKDEQAAADLEKTSAGK